MNVLPSTGVCVSPHVSPIQWTTPDKKSAPRRPNAIATPVRHALCEPAGMIASGRATAPSPVAMIGAAVSMYRWVILSLMRQNKHVLQEPPPIEMVNERVDPET